MIHKKIHGKGFSLLAVLLLLFFITAICVGISKMNEQERHVNHLTQKRQRVVNAAFSAADIALARLQQIAGTDAVITSFHPHNPDNPGTVVWNVNHPPAHFPQSISKETPVPLISESKNPEQTGTIKLPNHNKSQEKISVPWEYVGEQFRFAYAIFDESLKYPLIPPSEKSKQARTQDLEEEQRKNQLANPNKTLKTQRKLIAEASNQETDKIKLAQYDSDWFFKEYNDPLITPDTSTLNTFSVLADWPRNQLKQDLSENETQCRMFPNKFFENWNRIFPKHTNEGVPVALEEVTTHEAFGLCHHAIPIIVDLKLHVGFFNPRSDGQHRARFHISTKLWNPNSFPILAHADGNFGLLDFSNLPVFVIQNKNTNAEFSVGLSDFPTGRFGLVRQTPSDKTFNVHCKIFDASDQGFGNASESPEPGLHPGEVYLALFPNPAGQPEGLSRITGGPSWKFQKGNDPSKPPSKTIDGRWFHDLHKINIFSVPSIFPGEIVLRHFNGSFPQSMFPEDYSPPILKLENIAFPPVNFYITGKEYNRQKAGEYSIEQANLVYRIRLKSEDPTAMNALFKNIDLRNPVLDFSNPFVEQAFEITAHVGNEAQKLSEIEDDESKSYFFDRFVNKHATENATPPFSSIQVYDLPNRQQISVGTLRLFHQTKLPPHALGKALEKIQKEKINQIFDQYFFSSKIRHEKIITTENHFLRKKDEKLSLKEFQSEEEINIPKTCLIRGPFNINSTNPEAWKLMLTNAFENWIQFPSRLNSKTMSWDKNHPPKNLKNVFFTRPFTAQVYSPDGKIQTLSDEELEKAPRRSREQYLLTQGLRSIPQEKINRLSSAIAKRVKQRLEARNPFYSIEEFANSAILKEAIKEAKINELSGEKIPEWFPTALKQEHLLEALCLQASPRGDTFRIVVRAEYLNPITQHPEAGANVEILVQRYPDFFDESQEATTPYEECNAQNRRFGRRFKIISRKVLPN